MTLKQLWSIFRGRRTNFSWMNASWTYYPEGDPMSQLRTTCFWCNVDPRKEMPNGISPHSTWCPQYRSPPSAREIKRQFDEMIRDKDAPVSRS